MVDRTNDIFLEALESAKSFSRRMEENREKRLWKDVTIPCTLSVAINRLSNDEMHKIRKNLNLKRLSALKKADLASELVRKIPDKFKQIMYILDQGRYSLIKKIAQNSGVIKDRGISVSAAESLLGYSIVFPGMHNNQKVLFMPSELVQLFMQIDGPDLEKRVKRNKEWILLTQGMLYYYGVMAEVLIIKRIEQLTGKKVDILEYFNVMSSAMDYYGQVDYFSSGLKDHRVFDAKKIADEHKKRAGVDYYPFTKKQLLKAGVPDYIDHTPAMNNFIGFLLERYELSDEETTEIVSQLINIINADGKQKDILEYLQNWLELPSFDLLQMLTREITELYNNTRQWALKGHTPEELFQEEKKYMKPLPSEPFNVEQANSKVIDLKTRSKIGRNEPCPCGSGKKFKRCCGK